LKQAGYSANISTGIRNDNYISLESVEKYVVYCNISTVILKPKAIIWMEMTAKQS